MLGLSLGTPLVATPAGLWWRCAIGPPRLIIGNGMCFLGLGPFKVAAIAPGAGPSIPNNVANVALRE